MLVQHGNINSYCKGIFDFFFKSWCFFIFPSKAVRKGGSGTKGKIEKIEKLSNILKERCYYLNSSMLEYLEYA